MNIFEEVNNPLAFSAKFLRKFGSVFRFKPKEYNEFLLEKLEKKGIIRPRPDQTQNPCEYEEEFSWLKESAEWTSGFVNLVTDNRKHYYEKEILSRYSWFARRIMENSNWSVGEPAGPKITTTNTQKALLEPIFPQSVLYLQEKVVGIGCRVHGQNDPRWARGGDGETYYFHAHTDENLFDPDEPHRRLLHIINSQVMSGAYSSETKKKWNPKKDTAFISLGDEIDGYFTHRDYAVYNEHDDSYQVPCAESESPHCVPSSQAVNKGGKVIIANTMGPQERAKAEDFDRYFQGGGNDEAGKHLSNVYFTDTNISNNKRNGHWGNRGRHSKLLISGSSRPNILQQNNGSASDVEEKDWESYFNPKPSSEDVVAVNGRNVWNRPETEQSNGVRDPSRKHSRIANGDKRPSNAYS